MVERHLAKVNVASSNLVFRSKAHDTFSGVVLFLYLFPLDTNINKVEIYIRRAYI